eukprot:1506836-Amphidinium_carterae.1
MRAWTVESKPPTSAMTSSCHRCSVASINGDAACQLPTLSETDATCTVLAIPLSHFAACCVIVWLAQPQIWPYCTGELKVLAGHPAANHCTRIST